VTEVYVLGDDPEDRDLPAVVMLDMPPGYVLFRHAHVCHRFEVVVKGSLTAGERTLVPGDVMTARPGEWYGPHVAGPDGCTTAEVFGTVDGVFRVLAETGESDSGRRGQREFDFRRGEVPPDYQPLV
jgi:anti-sigma factor ChrR (cupin superfamily)